MCHGVVSISNLLHVPRARSIQRPKISSFFALFYMKWDRLGSFKSLYLHIYNKIKYDNLKFKSVICLSFLQCPSLLLTLAPPPQSVPIPQRATCVVLDRDLALAPPLPSHISKRSVLHAFDVSLLTPLPKGSSNNVKTSSS